MPSTRFKILPALLFALALASAPLRAQYFEGQADTRQYVNGMSWRIYAPAELARGDDYWVIAGIEFHPRYIDRDLTLLPGCVVLELTAPDGAVRTHVLKRSGLPKTFKMENPDETNVSFNLREAFGELEPGPWVARWILREGRYRVDGHATSSEVVAEHRFQIFSVTRKAAEQTSNPTRDVVLDIPPLDAKSLNTTTATLTNRTDRPIEFSAAAKEAVLGPPAFFQPLSVPVVVERFVPPAPWRNHSGGFLCGTGLLAYRLDPGESVTVTIAVPPGAQVMRVRLSYRYAGDPTFTPREAISHVIESPAR